MNEQKKAEIAEWFSKQVEGLSDEEARIFFVQLVSTATQQLGVRGFRAASVYAVEGGGGCSGGNSLVAKDGIGGIETNLSRYYRSLIRSVDQALSERAENIG